MRTKRLTVTFMMSRNQRIDPGGCNNKTGNPDTPATEEDRHVPQAAKGCGPHRKKCSCANHSTHQAHYDSASAPKRHVVVSLVFMPWRDQSVAGAPLFRCACVQRCWRKRHCKCVSRSIKIKEALGRDMQQAEVTVPYQLQ